MPPPLMPPSIQKPQKSSPNSLRARSIRVLRVQIGGPRNDGLNRAVEVALQAVRRARECHRAASWPVISIEDSDCLAAAEPLRLAAQQVLLSDHLKNGTDILRHAAVNQHQALLKFLAAFARDFGFVKILWSGSRHPRLMPNSGSPSAARTPWISLMPGHTPPESCQPPPLPPSHSPRMARAATSRRSALPSPR